MNGNFSHCAVCDGDHDTEQCPAVKALREDGNSAEEVLGEAMQDVWNDRCVDCGEMPACFNVHGPKTTRVAADFEGSAFVHEVIETLKARGYYIRPRLPAPPCQVKP
ncbi:MAG: hypothetical protein WC718_00370 [Phycisphaerales bacterium]|jgi:hypothetical protein